MQISLRSLTDAHEHFEKRFETSLFPPVQEATVDRRSLGKDRASTTGEAFRVVSPVTLSFDVDRQEPGRYRVSGHLTGELELTCSRCLEPFSLPVAADFDLRVRAASRKRRRR